MPRPTRRALLISVPGFAVAGCVDDTSSGDPSDGSNPTDDPDQGQPDEDRSGGDATGDLDGSLPPEGTFPGDCPEYDDVALVVAFDGIDPAETAIYLEPSADAVAEGDRISFELRNESGRTFSHNPYRWLLHKRVDGRWHYVAPGEWPEPLARLASGERHGWDLSVNNEGIEDGEAIARSGDGPDPIRGLGGGEYAFGTRGWFEGARDEGVIGFCARFDLEADALALAPTDAIVGIDWDGDTLVATSERGDPDHESTRLGAYELLRTDDVEGETLITESLLRDDQLRDAIALAREYDADRVRLEEYNGIHPIFGIQSERHYEYDGETYAISATELERDD